MRLGIPEHALLISLEHQRQLFAALIDGYRSAFLRQVVKLQSQVEGANAESSSGRNNIFEPGAEELQSSALLASCTSKTTEAKLKRIEYATVDIFWRKLQGQKEVGIIRMRKNSAATLIRAASRFWRSRFSFCRRFVKASLEPCWYFSLTQVALSRREKTCLSSEDTLSEVRTRFYQNETYQEGLNLQRLS